MRTDVERKEGMGRDRKRNYLTSIGCIISSVSREIRSSPLSLQWNFQKYNLFNIHLRNVYEYFQLLK